MTWFPTVDKVKSQCIDAIQNECHRIDYLISAAFGATAKPGELDAMWCTLRVLDDQFPWQCCIPGVHTRAVCMVSLARPNKLIAFSPESLDRYL